MRLLRQLASSLRSVRHVGVLPSFVTRRTAILTALIALVAAPAAQAGELPMQLPGDASASAVRADADTWMVGARPDAASAAIARRYGARRSGARATGTYVVARDRARAFAHALGERLVYAEPNALLRLASVPDDPLSAAPNDWRRTVADPAVDPPAVTPQSPLIALVDAAADATHPEWTGDPNFSVLTPATPVTNPHGTATAAVAAAPVNGIGVVGVWPGARALNVPLKTVPGTDGEISCAASADAIGKAVQAGAAVINMSYGSTSECTAEKIQIYYGVAKGVIPVAAAGNEFEQGNPLEFPASLPHVVTVAATDADGRSAAFSNANDAVDLAAPGVGILTAVPPALDTDGTPDGYAALSGTSFAAPMVSAAMAWIRQARPDLKPDQAIQAVRLSAHDVGRKGWDALTGFGVLDIKAALDVDKDKLPIHDPAEPNDNLVWVDGRAFGGRPADAIWSGGRAMRLNALLDKEEDPSDVYRIVLNPGRSARISAIPRFGDVELTVFRSSAVSINDKSGRAARSAKAGAKKTERVTVANKGKRAHSYYVEVSPQGSSVYQDRAYTLRVG
jgi:subtilisin family serine protease